MSAPAGPLIHPGDGYHHRIDKRLMRTLPSDEIDRIIEMAWEDRTTFDAIHGQFGLTEREVIALMRAELKPSSFRMWRKRVTGRKTKHGFTTRSERFRAACHR